MTRTGLAAAALALGLLAGCGPKTGVTVSGAVTYDGAPVKKGSITLTPSDGKGQATGGEIADGKYKVADVPPGPKTVMIAAVEEPTGGPVSTEDLKNASLDPKKKGAAAPPPGIPPNAVGNGATLDVSADDVTKNFDLKKPGSK